MNNIKAFDNKSTPYETWDDDKIKEAFDKCLNIIKTQCLTYDVVYRMESSRK